MKAELTKGDVYVVVDTPKKAKKLKKLLDMFDEPIFNPPNHKYSGHNGTDDGWGYGFSGGQWQGFNTKSIAHNGKKFKKVSIKKLRNILAKEHLISGEYIVATIGKIKYLVEFDRVGKIGFIIGKKYLPFSEFGRNVEPYGWGGFDYFDRYATPEEIALLEPKPKELEVGKWYKTKSVVCIFYLTEIQGDYRKNKGYGLLNNNEWFDNRNGTFFMGRANDLDNFTEATPQEVEQALIEEAKKLGHTYERFDYNPEENELCGINNGRLEYVFCDGNWEQPTDKFAELKEAHKNGKEIQWRRNIYGGFSNWTDFKDNNPVWSDHNEYRINPSSPIKVGDWMFNPNYKKITQVKKDNHGKSLIGSGWVKIKDTELIEKLNSL